MRNIGRRFWQGLFAPLRALKLIFTSPVLLSLILIPLAINIGLYALFFYYGAEYLDQLVLSWNNWIVQSLPQWLNFLSKPLYWSLKLLSWLMLTLVAALTFTIISGIVASPFNDVLSKQTLRVHSKTSIPLISGMRPKATHSSNHVLTFKLSMWLETKRTLILIIGGLTALLLGIIPFMQIPALALGALLVSFEYFGYPISQSSASLRSVWRFTLRHLPVSIGFGLFLLLLMAIPFASVIYIPLAVVTGTLLYADLNLNK